MVSIKRILTYTKSLYRFLFQTVQLNAPRESAETLQGLSAPFNDRHFAEQFDVNIEWKDLADTLDADTVVNQFAESSSQLESYLLPF